MRKSILIGVSIVTVAGILLAAIALGFTDTRTKINAFAGTEGKGQVNEKAIAKAQANVSFNILEPNYLPSGYRFESVSGTKFHGATNDIEMASFSYKNGDDQFEVKEMIILNIKNRKESSTLPNDTREIIEINGIEGRFSEENGRKLLSWKIGNLSLGISSWKNEGRNMTGSSHGKDEMIKVAESIGDARKAN